MRHFYVLADQVTACGAEQEFSTCELGFVTCRDCQRIVAVREILGAAS